jgi:hypothetical protein
MKIAKGRRQCTLIAICTLLFTFEIPARADSYYEREHINAM